jgi:glutaredoxin-related protein
MSTSEFYVSFSNDGKTWTTKKIGSRNSLLEFIRIQKRHVYIYHFKEPQTIDTQGNVLISKPDETQFKDKTFHFFCKSHCPFTRAALDKMLGIKRNYMIVIHNVDVHPRLRERLNVYRNKINFKSTFPQIFYKGRPLGGSDTFLNELSKKLK